MLNRDVISTAMRRTGLLAVVFSFSVFSSVSSAEQSLTSLLPGEHDIGMRTRFQAVDDRLAGDADAFTTRLVLTSRFQLDEDEQWQLLLEPNYVHAFNKGDFNSVTVRQNTSSIPDPHGFNWNQGYLSFNSDYDWHLQLGRQLLTFDNQRMIGSVEFWQTPQRFDALKFDYNDQVAWHIQYAYSNKVHRIFGRQSQLTIPTDDIRFDDFAAGHLLERPVGEWGEHRLDAHLLNVNYKTDNNLELVGYSYLVENKDLSWFSNHTSGVRIADEFKPQQLKYRYVVEYAMQRDYANNPWDYQAWYSLLEASVQYKSHRFQLNQEVFSEDGGRGFITPLGSNHKFQGWADAFSGYGLQSGVRDLYVTYRGRYNKLRWRAVWHDFNTYRGSYDIGREFDIELAYRLTRKLEFKLVYADYRPDGGIGSFPRLNNRLRTFFASVAYNI